MRTPFYIRMSLSKAPARPSSFFSTAFTFPTGGPSKGVLDSFLPPNILLPPLPSLVPSVLSHLATMANHRAADAAVRLEACRYSSPGHSLLPECMMTVQAFTLEMLLEAWMTSFR